MTDPRPHRPVPLPPEIVSAIGDLSTADTTPRAELLEALESALRLLPAPERRAVLLAHADDEGVAAVAAALGLSDDEADALTRSGVQLLRGALADLEQDPPPAYARARRRLPSPKPPAD